VHPTEIEHIIDRLIANADTKGKTLLVHTALKKYLKQILDDMISDSISPAGRALDSLYDKVQLVFWSFLDVRRAA
jgi:hypothetical protein